MLKNRKQWKDSQKTEKRLQQKNVNLIKKQKKVTSVDYNVKQKSEKNLRFEEKRNKIEKKENKTKKELKKENL